MEEKIVKGFFTIFFIIFFSILCFIMLSEVEFLEKETFVRYSVYTDKTKWREYSKNVELPDTFKNGNKILALKMKLETDKDMEIKYSTYTFDSGWSETLSGNKVVGDIDSQSGIQGIKIHVAGPDSDFYDVKYRAYIQDTGWTDWVSGWDFCGSEDFTLDILGLDIKLVPFEKISKKDISKNLPKDLPRIVPNKESKEDSSDLVTRLDVPLISQKPEIPTGAEIASSAMLFQYAGINIDKVALAKDIPKSSDPNKGFVGNPFSNSGWTVYPKGLISTYEKYLGSSNDLTGMEITDIEKSIQNKKPVLAWCKGFPGFKTHTIVITGYDNEYFYYNDSSLNKKDAQIDRETFIERWSDNQRMAISY